MRTSTATTSAQVPCDPGTISGAGSTFAQNIAQQWIKDFQAKCSGATINYQGVGSGAGIQQFTAGTIDFGASDVPMSATEEQGAVAKGGQVQTIPWTGGGIAVDGRVLVGPNAVAGEWGHNPLPWPREGEWPGPACYCGKTACIETFLSGPGLALDHERATGEKVLAPELARRAAAGDRAAEATLVRYEDRMARALAGVINILDPDVIVLGGGMSNLKRLYEAVPRLWTRYAFSDRVDTRLRAAVHGDSSGVRGAAWLWPETELP